MTLSEIKNRCVEVGDCWVWQQGVNAFGYPQMTSVEHKTKLVRRVALALDGRAPAPRQPVLAVCGDRLCVNPEHLQASTTAKIAREAARRGAFSSLTRAAAIARGKQRSAVAKLDMDKARAIRASNDPAWQLAQQYGVNKSLITRVRRGQAWKEYASPWAGLM